MIPLADRPHVVYRAYSHAGALLYVGCSFDLKARIVQDHRRSGWWPLCAEITVEEFPDRQSALDAEAAAISTEIPVFNLMGTPASLSQLLDDPPIRPHVAYQPRHLASAP